MIVDDLRREMEGERLVLSARLTWENCDRKPNRIRFEVESHVADDVECSPNAFFAATAVPAMFYGEERLLVEGKICPVLHDNILTVFTQLREWYDKNRPLPAIDSTEGFAARKPRAPRRAGQFFSGGIDALATLRRNRLMYPSEHPLSIRDCINVFGMHLDDYDAETAAPKPERVELWDRNLKRLRGIADAAGVEIYQVRTNVLGLFDRARLFCYEYHSAIMLSLAHLVTRRLSDVYLASSFDLGTIEPWGSHPLIDPYYASSDLRIFHDGARLTRLDKVRLVSEWPEAMSMLNVCSSWWVPESGMNCGKCGKCVRTMTELLVCGKLGQAPTFPADDVTAAHIDAIKFRSDADVEFFTECLPYLREMGRDDLIEAIERRFADHRQWLRRLEGRGFWQRLKRFDERFLGSQLRRRWQALRGAPPEHPSHRYTQSERIASRRES